MPKRQPTWSRNSLRYKLKYLENQENYFNQKGLMCRVLKNLSYEINLYQWPCSPLKRCCPAFHLIFYIMILFMKLNDLHGQVMVKTKIGNIISAPKNDKLSNYLCQHEQLCGCKFLLHLGQKHVKYDFSKLDNSEN